VADGVRGAARACPARFERAQFRILRAFALAGVARLISVGYLSGVHEPPLQRQPSDHFTLMEFVRRAPRAHFGRFVFYCTLINVGHGAITPFLGWHLLEQLGFSPGMFAAVLAIQQLAGVATQPLWGRWLDRMGSKRVLAIGGLGLGCTPLLLMACNTVTEFLVVQCFDGLVFAAFTIAVSNYFYDVVTPPKRARCIAYHTLFVSAGTMVGSFAAAGLGQLARGPLAATVLGDAFLLILVGAAGVRWLANVALLGSFAEFRVRQPRFNDVR